MQIDAMFHDLARFWASFSSQNRYKIGSRTEDLENRKTLQNTAWASKNQGFGLKPRDEKHEKDSLKLDSKKDRPKSAKNANLGALGARFGGPK